MKPRINITMLGAYQHGKTTVLDAMTVQRVIKGDRIDCGCDPCMTPEGRLLDQKLRELKQLAKDASNCK